ncbi:MAG: AttT protein [Pseudohongiella sp.]|nr:MAG: AttT protein [Pseudohongiella sp.]
MTELVSRDELPDIEEYRNLRVTCGLSPRSRDAASKGLPNSLFSTTVRDKTKLIGMGRIVGDGGCNLEVVDIAVHPNYQRRGIGQAIMANIMSYIENNAPESAYVSLIADDHSPALYSKYGFELTTPRSVGMALKVSARDT